jgi:hypothetical protein
MGSPSTIHMVTDSDIVHAVVSALYLPTKDQCIFDLVSLKRKIIMNLRTGHYTCRHIKNVLAKNKIFLGILRIKVIMDDQESFSLICNYPYLKIRRIVFRETHMVIYWHNGEVYTHQW